MTTPNDIRRLVKGLSPKERLKLIAAVASDLAEELAGAGGGAGGGRRSLPRLAQMLEWGVIDVHDRLYVKGHEDQPAVLLDDHQVAYRAEVMGVNAWAQAVTGWQSISIYEWVVQERTGKTLGQIRQEYMDAHGLT